MLFWKTLSKQPNEADGIYKDEEGFFSLLLVITFCCFMVNLRFIFMTILSVFSQEQAMCRPRLFNAGLSNPCTLIIS